MVLPLAKLVALPVTLPVRLPEKLLPLASAICSDDVQESVELTQLNVLSVAPFKVIPPPSAVESVGVVTLPSSKFLSSTLTVLLEIVVVVPLTVQLRCH
jgi:hypothetical protein